MQIHKVLRVFVLTLLFAPVFAQSIPDNKNVPSLAPNMQQDTYHQQIMSLMGKLNNTKTDEARQMIYDSIQRTVKQYRANHPIEELSRMEKEARLKKMEETLRKDSFQWQRYQSQQTVMKARTQAERENILTKIQNLETKRVAAEEAVLTSQQKAARKMHQEKTAMMQAELKPLMEKMRAAETKGERQIIHTQIQDVFKKYH